eukprot:5972199-Amphidinium_carterae.1
MYLHHVSSSPALTLLSNVLLYSKVERHKPAHAQTSTPPTHPSRAEQSANSIGLVSSDPLPSDCM